MVDDIHIRTGYLLNEFLSTEKKRWRLEKRFPQTTIFVKLNGDDLIDPAGWIGQPFCSVARPIPGVASLAERLRFHLRIRTRLRNLQEGSSGSWPIGKDR